MASAGLGVLAVLSTPVAVFWLLGDRLDEVCREGVPEHCGLWKAPQHWDPATVRVFGIVAAATAVVSAALLLWAWYREMVSIVWMKATCVLMAAGTLVGIGGRVMSARADDDGDLSAIVWGPLLLAAGALVVWAVSAVVRARSEASP